MLKDVHDLVLAGRKIIICVAEDGNQGRPFLDRMSVSVERD